MTDMDRVFYALLGELDEDTAFSWVENAFLPGSPCRNAREEIRAAQLRLCDRLGQTDDEDVQIIVDGFYDIQEELCKKMFLYGMIYGRMKE